MRTGFYDNASDTMAAIRFMKTTDNIQHDRIFLLGHSEGAFIATKLAAEGADIAGVTLIAGAIKSGKETLKWQAIQVAKEIKGINGLLIKLFRIDVAKAQQNNLIRSRNPQRTIIEYNILLN